MSDVRQFALAARAWPFEEARKLLKRYEKAPPAKGYVLFETGYGPSGLPHIGTFGEVARTSWVRRAFEAMSDIPTRLFSFSDDMDGLRKVPDNVPNPEMLREFLGKPLTQIPDPFGTHESFGHHNNARLRAFLDRFGFEYEFKSATDCYRSGQFDQALLNVLKNYDAIMAVMLPTLGAERQATYSPFMPISPKTGKVLQVPIEKTDAGAGTIVFRDEDGTLTEVPVTGGQCKLQWKPDWGMRWHALGVDYEMSGKDLIPSVELAGKICRILGSTPPEGFSYELFLDEKGEKISKSKGNGLSVDEWLTYAPPESLALFMYQKPRAAKRLYFDVIPRAVDEYHAFLFEYDREPSEPPLMNASEEEKNSYDNLKAARRLENPVWHLHRGQPPADAMPLSFGMLLNLASVCHAEDKSVLWGFLTRYLPGTTPATNPALDRLVGYALAYYRDFVKPAKKYRAPSDMERAALSDLLAELEKLPVSATAEEIQTHIYEVGKRHPFADLKAWFGALYQILLGQEQGPRFGSFVALYGLVETKALIGETLRK